MSHRHVPTTAFAGGSCFRSVLCAVHPLRALSCGIRLDECVQAAWHVAGRAHVTGQASRSLCGARCFYNGPRYFGVD